MSKAYSNKALPSGTVLREWRLEEVLGVGGFGIVYKGRGIYFDELVAIKEYFPSSISERDAEDTVVPIDSDAEEVHALGLKKFVEEAKLLWNLSSPSRHPNIVSVRSLFEIHGTAYMVMDFEDGTSLSKLLKEGARFNERSLLNIIRPIAEGLDRAHRVGVLHRDIKPPNILINEDGRPVLIDFGSARFEAAEATSTKVTFHTPPYAAIEQYVKTYAQGPWTDIYALGVVLYECVTGTKPPEVLERLHGGLGESLAAGKWPGYSRKFLEAVDAAMTIRPTDRPQSIADWLTLFDGGKRKASRTVSVPVDDEATRIVPYDTPADEIAPVVAAASRKSKDKPIETGVPAKPSEAEFKRAGQDTGASKINPAAAAAAAAAGAAAATSEAPSAEKGPEPHAEKKATPAKDEPAPEPVKPAARKPLPAPVLAGGAAVALLAVLGGVWALSGGDKAGEGPSPISSTIAATPAVATDAGMDGGQLLLALQGLADDAQAAGAPENAGSVLVGAISNITTLNDEAKTRPDDSEAAAEMQRLATGAARDFAIALGRTADMRMQQLAADVPWANPAREAAARSQPQDRQRVASNIRLSLAGLRSAVEQASAAKEFGGASEAARGALVQYGSLAAAARTARDQHAAASPTEPAKEAERSTPAPPTAKRPSATAATTRAAPAASAPVTAGPATAATLNELRGIVRDGRSTARQVIKLGDRKKPRSDASDREKEGYEIRRANVALARNYDSNLATLEAAIGGLSSESEAQRMVKQAKQTRAYVDFLIRRSTETLSW